MTLSSAVETYVMLKQSLGTVFSVDGRILRAFVRAVGDVPANAITPDLCTAFCAAKVRRPDSGHANTRRFEAYSGT